MRTQSPLITTSLVLLGQRRKRVLERQRSVRKLKDEAAVFELVHVPDASSSVLLWPTSS